MSQIARFGVSLEKELLGAFDGLCAAKGYATRSEAIRDLIRGALAEEQWAKGGICCGALTLVYDHHKHDLARRIMELQHRAHHLVIATLHAHLDHDNCMEILMLKGCASEIAELAKGIGACRGVKFSAFNRAPTGEELA